VGSTFRLTTVSLPLQLALYSGNTGKQLLFLIHWPKYKARVSLQILEIFIVLRHYFVYELSFVPSLHIILLLGIIIFSQCDLQYMYISF